MYHYKNGKEDLFVLVVKILLWYGGFLRLSGRAKLLWIYLRAEYDPNKTKRHPKSGKLMIYLPYSKMEKVRGFSRKAMSRAIKELIDKKFIERTKQGGKLRGKSAYRFIGKFKIPREKKDKKKRRRRSKTWYPFVMVLKALLWDEEFIKLSVRAKLLWVYLRAEFSPETAGWNQGSGKLQVYLPYKKMQKVRGLHREAMYEAIKELVDKKFIEITEHGGLPKGRNAYHFIGKFEEIPGQKNYKKK